MSPRHGHRTSPRARTACVAAAVLCVGALGACAVRSVDEAAAEPPAGVIRQEATNASNAMNTIDHAR